MFVAARLLKRAFLFCSIVAALFSFFSILPIFSLVVAAEFNIGPGDVNGLIGAINSANASSDPDVINLSAGSTYLLTGVNSDIGHDANGLPVISTDITINGNEATILRDNAAPPFRIFEVAFPGKLALYNMSVRNGRGDDSEYGGGGILNFDCILSLYNFTFS